jgi:hypothetical protein
MTLGSGNTSTLGTLAVTAKWGGGVLGLFYLEVYKEQAKSLTLNLVAANSVTALRVKV